MAKRKLKKSVKRNFIIFILLIIICIVGVKCYKTYKYHQTYEYKLLEKNYTLKDTKILTKKLSNKQLENILSRKHNESIVQFVNEKYFIYTNLDRYLLYQSKNLKEKTINIITLVNVNRDKDYYDKTVSTNTALKEAMLVNKYHVLDANYSPENLVTASSSYAYANNSLNSDAYEAFKELADAAKLEGYTILILDSYRSYEAQDTLWKSRKETYGIRKADQYAARAGSSEHETGYAIDVADFHDTNDDFGATDSFKWMIKNSYKYGFILRYPEGKENITGYSYEAWHYRFLGKDLAEKVYKSGLTYDEYYEFYLNNVKL
jgi:zinc D-Ala-D-Ala carboxypeptidase